MSKCDTNSVPRTSRLKQISNLKPNDNMKNVHLTRVVDGSQNTRDFHFPQRNNVKISKYAPILTFQITLSLQVNFHLALRKQRKKKSEISENLKFQKRKKI